jgi:hypothetical protein
VTLGSVAAFAIELVDVEGRVKPGVIGQLRNPYTRESAATLRALPRGQWLAVFLRFETRIVVQYFNLHSMIDAYVSSSEHSRGVIGFHPPDLAL